MDVAESNGCIITASGTKFDILNPTPEMVNLIDIVWALSHQCRWTGHATGFYSVAEHSCVVARFCDRKHRKQALLHDAAEAYIGDISRPIKKLIPQIVEVEEKIRKVIFAKLEVEFELAKEVIEADKFAFELERNHVIPNVEWFPPYPDAICAGLIRCLKPLEAVADWNRLWQE